MPIEYSKEIIYKNQDEFHQIDNIVTKQAFNIHNKFGRFCHEKIYKIKLNEYCKNEGFVADSEVAIKVSYKDFEKLYYIDLLVNNGVIYELKTVDNFTNTNEQQIINYMLLTGLNHGKLINFKTKSVEKQFISNNFTLEKRKIMYFDDSHWDNNIKNSNLLKSALKEILNNWGAFLDFKLYQKALIHFLGGEYNVISNIDIIENNKIIDQQKACLLNKNTSFHLSALTKNTEGYSKHIYRLLKHSNLEVIQWINFNKNKIDFITIKKQ